MGRKNVRPGARRREAMKFCPRCQAEYHHGITQCSECGGALVFRFPIATADSETVTDLVVVRTFNNKFEADLARTTLEAAGIESMMRSDDYGGRGPNLSFILGIDLLVRSEDAEDAAQILSLDVR
jgi:hypothetical protein